MLAFLARAHMVDAAPMLGLGWGGVFAFPARAQIVDATPMLGLGCMGWGGMSTFLARAWSMLRQRWGWGWVGVGRSRFLHVRKLSFLAHARMVDATPMLGLGLCGVRCYRFLHVHTWLMLRQCWVWSGVGWDVNVSCMCFGKTESRKK